MSQRKNDHRAIASDHLFAGCHVPPVVKVGKRLIDITVALAMLVLTAPIWVVVLAGLALEGGPILVAQRRVGRVLADRTELFSLLGFGGGRFGAMLRGSRIDELPQVLNLLRGDVSLVGPHPEAPEYYARLDRIAPCFADRMIGLRPGLTGISPAALSDDIVRRVELDAAYALSLQTVGSWLQTDAAIVLHCAWLLPKPKA